MANIKDKNLNDLSDWNLKELRKLKINLKNRIEKLKVSEKSELQKSNPLFGKDINECESLLEDIRKAEKKL